MRNSGPKIVIDATALPKEPVGAGRYIINLIHQILTINEEFDIKVIAHEDDFDLFDLNSDKKQHFIFIKDFGRAYRLIWEQIGLPFLLLKEKADCYHGLHYSRPILTPCPTITTIHDMTFFVMPEKHIWLKRFYFRFFIIYSNWFSRLLLSVSENTKKDLKKFLNVSNEKIIVTPLGVSEKYKRINDDYLLDSTREKYHLPDQFLLFVGLIEPRKNVPLLLESYAEIVKDNQNKDLKLVIAGRLGWGSDNINQLVDNLEINDDVFFPGYIDEEDLPSLLSLADIFVYPSAYEGFGLPVLEAMACGTPVITTNISSMPEFVGDNGILISPNNKSELVKAIKTMINQKNDVKFQTEKLINRAKQFTWKKTAELTLAAYFEVVGK